MNSLTIELEVLELGKYTAGYAKLTPEQLHGLLWLLGEWSIRTTKNGTIIGSKSRAIAARNALLEFHSKPYTLDEAQTMLRQAHK